MGFDEVNMTQKGMAGVSFQYVIYTFVTLSARNSGTATVLFSFPIDREAIFILIPMTLVPAPLVKMERTKSLSISINLEEDDEITKKIEGECLIGKIMLDKTLNENVVESVVKKEWKCLDDFSVSCITRNMFMFSFRSKEDLKMVRGDSPWTVLGGLLVLSVWGSGKVPKELSFSYSAFRVQVHGLPINCSTPENASKIGEYLGIFAYADTNVFDGKICWRKFLRLRVILDVRNPILTGFWLRRPRLKDIWIDFKYEKLGLFCYECGRIGIRYSRCKFSRGNGKFGPWLRADPWDEAAASGSKISTLAG